MKTIRRYIVIDAYWDAWDALTDEQAKVMVKDALDDIKGLKDVQIRLMRQEKSDD